jgi:hypothetical protein
MKKTTQSSAKPKTLKTRAEQKTTTEKKTTAQAKSAPRADTPDWETALKDVVKGYAQIVEKSAPQLKTAVDDWYNVVKWGYVSSILVQKAIWSKIELPFEIDKEKLKDAEETFGKWLNDNIDAQADWGKKLIDTGVDWAKKAAGK